MKEGNLLNRRKFVQLVGCSTAAGAMGTLAPWLPGSHGNDQPEKSLGVRDQALPVPRFVYVGSCGRVHGKLTADSLEQGIHVFTVDGDRWTLTQIVPSASPSFLALHPTQRFLYAVNEIDNYRGLPAGTIEAYSVHAQDGRLTLLNRQPLSLSGISPKHLAISPDGRSLIVAVYGGGAYNVLPIATEGRLGRVSGIVKETGSGPDREYQNASHPRMVTFDHSGRYLLATDLGTDHLNVFSLTGDKLTPNFRIGTESGSGPAHLALHPSGRRLYVLHELEAALSCYTYDPDNGQILERLRYVSAAPKNLYGRSRASALAMHPSGDFLYAAVRSRKAGRDMAGSIAVWNVNSSRCAPAPVQYWMEGVHLPQAITVVPDGTGLLVADSRQILRLGIDLRNGYLSEPARVVDVPAPASVALKYL